MTGYKSHEIGIFSNKHPGVQYIKKALEKQLSALQLDGLEWIVISGQLGVELWAAEVAFDLHLRVAVLTPFLQQEKNWNEQTKEYYHGIVERADYVNSITNKEYENPLQLKWKNQYIIDKSDGLLVLYDEEKGGSPKFYLEPAKVRQQKDGYEIRLITPHDIQLIVEEISHEDPNYWNN